MAEQGVLWQVPEGRLYHLEISAAQAVHEGGQKVSSNAVRGTCSQGTCLMAQEARPQSPQYALTSHGLAQLAWDDSGFTYLGLFWMERSARLKARLRQDSSAELISRCKLVCSGERRVSPWGLTLVVTAGPVPKMPPGQWDSTLQFGAVPGLHSSRVRTRPQPGLFPASLTEKKPRTSGLRRDISSMSLRVSSTSKGKKSGCRV